jgi:hypothetical protein
MSKHETALTLRYWESVGGTLLEEFYMVPTTPKQGKRVADAVIIKGGQTIRVPAGQRKMDLKGEDVIVVQTKGTNLEGRVGMNLLGQAYFSAELLKEFHRVRSVHAVAICTKRDEALEKVVQAIPHMEIIVYDETDLADL